MAIDTTDPNWLLSSVAQSAAALVAIIGGFLVSRLVSLAVERNRLLERQRDLANRLGLQRKRLGVARYERMAGAESSSWTFASLKWSKPEDTSTSTNC
jgi:hypothetical protein